MTARKDLDYIGREELLEALKRVSVTSWKEKKCCAQLTYVLISHINLFMVYASILQQKGTFETGQEDKSEVPEELKLRLAYREAAVSVLSCYFPDPHRPFMGVGRYVICHYGQN